MDHGRNREAGQRPPHVPAFVATLQAAGEQDVESDPGHHPELSGESYGPGQLPTRDADSHPALKSSR
ncbi:hypothetical protein GCM10009682_03540 [Luedemannella flava]|uniref:Uncharacterized protein n=1 Tax=Luedemannella flava TaxID=349316 RepID=A0ABP4XMG8_9ACTN